MFPSCKVTVCVAAFLWIIGGGGPRSQFQPLGFPVSKKFMNSVPCTSRRNTKTRDPWPRSDAMGYGQGSRCAELPSSLYCTPQSAKHISNLFSNMILEEYSSESHSDFSLCTGLTAPVLLTLAASSSNGSEGTGALKILPTAEGELVEKPGSSKIALGGLPGSALMWCPSAQCLSQATAASTESDDRALDKVSVDFEDAEVFVGAADNNVIFGQNRFVPESSDFPVPDLSGSAWDLTTCDVSPQRCDEVQRSYLLMIPLRERSFKAPVRMNALCATCSRELAMLSVQSSSLL
mmetsp:Transcript_62279/g.165319  ORF Transcript_62279/g.165319 Transcript_62279/m.165319 type:complete len:292 (-) Transcript_62279:1087-1962(-)